MATCFIAATDLYNFVHYSVVIVASFQLFFLQYFAELGGKLFTFNLHIILYFKKEKCRIEAVLECFSMG